MKPKCVNDYCHFMGGVDLGDQMLNYSFLHCSIKWWRKLFIHMLNMLLLNAYILNKKFGICQMTHDEFREEIVHFLIEEGIKDAHIEMPTQTSRRKSKKWNDFYRLNERYFMQGIPAKINAKRSTPVRLCFACTAVQKIETVKLQKKYTYFWYPDCKKPLCSIPYFEIYHTNRNFAQVLHVIHLKESVWICKCPTKHDKRKLKQFYSKCAVYRSKMFQKLVYNLS